MSRLTRLLACAAFVLIALATDAASAHETGEGEDVAYAYLRATQLNGMTAVEVEILEPVPCDGFEARGLVAERLGTSVFGVIQTAGTCSFEGAIELNESGRWILIVQLALDERTAEASMPVGVSDTAGVFETETWFHAGSGDEGFLSGLAGLSTIGLYAVIGLAGLALAVFVLRGRESERATQGE